MIPRRSAASAIGPSTQPSTIRRGAAAGPQELHGPDPIGHATTAQRVRLAKGGEIARVGQERVHLVDGRRLVREPLDRRPEIAGLARRVGDAGHVVEAEPIGDEGLSPGEDRGIAAVVGVGDARLPGGEHHRDRHGRQPVDGPARQVGEDALPGVHRRDGRHGAGAAALAAPTAALATSTAAAASGA